MHHELKILPAYFEAGQCGGKNFEIRRNNDRGFQKGDTVEFREVTPESLGGNYTWRTFKAEITYVTNFNQKEDYVVFGYKLVEDNDE